MRHQKKGKKLSRDTAQRKALLKNLLANLFIHEEIKTTLSKAKAIKGLADRLINQVGRASLHRQRLIESFLQNKKAVEKLFQEIRPRFSQRTSGFTRIIRIGKRRGDDTIIAKIELVKKGEKKEKTRKGKADKKAVNSEKTKKSRNI